MNTFLIFTLLVAACAADVSHIVSKEATAAIVRSNQEASPDGIIKYDYETENGIGAQVEGSVTSELRGTYHYPGPDGNPIIVNWIAGPNGFLAEGPTVPKTPEHVVRTLEYNAAHPYKEPISP